MGVGFRSGEFQSAIWRWGPLILWMAVISGLSTDAFSAAETGRLLMPLLRLLFPGASPARLDLLHAVVRKGAHVTEFAILAFLWYRALDWRRSGWQTKAALTALVLAAGFGALDEAHQMFVPSRTASIVDVGWDSLGAALGLVGHRMVQR
jgi:VanZ family protein